MLIVGTVAELGEPRPAGSDPKNAAARRDLAGVIIIVVTQQIPTKYDLTKMCSGPQIAEGGLSPNHPNRAPQGIMLCKAKSKS